MTHEQSSHNHFQANMAPPPPEALGITLTRGHWKRSAVRKLLFFLFSFCKALHQSSHCKKLIRETPLSKSSRVIIGGIRASIYSLPELHKVLHPLLPPEFGLPSHISLYLRMCSMKWANGRDPRFLEFCLMLKKAVTWWQKLVSYLCLFRLAKIITLTKKVDQNCSYKYLM